MIVKYIGNNVLNCPQHQGWYERVGNKGLTTKETAQICEINFPFRISFLFTQIILNLNHMTKTYNFIYPSIQQSP
jgi:hypothetical protein